MSEQESIAGGPLGKVVGRARQLAGAALGSEDLRREGKLQEAERIRAEDERVAAQQAQVEKGAATREATDLHREAARAEEAAAAIDPKEER